MSFPSAEMTTEPLKPMDAELKFTRHDFDQLQCASRILESMSEWLDEDQLPSANTLMPDSDTETFGDAIRSWLLSRDSNQSRVISAAPELFDALRGIIRADRNLRELGTNAEESDERQYGRAIAIGVEAITKATKGF